MATKRFVSKDNLGRVWTRLFGKVLNSKEEIEANKSENMIAGADAVKEVYSSLQDQPTFEYDETGKITGYKTKIGGADTVFPFSSDMTFKVTARLRRRDGSGALSSTEKKIFYIYLKNGEFTWTSPQNIDGYQCILSCYGGWWNHFDIISIELV